MVIVNRYLPIAVPDRPLVLVGTGNTGPGTVDSLRMIKLASADVAQREVRQIEIMNVPRGRICVARNALTKNVNTTWIQ